MMVGPLGQVAGRAGEDQGVGKSGQRERAGDRVALARPALGRAKRILNLLLCKLAGHHSHSTR